MDTQLEMITILQMLYFGTYLSKKARTHFPKNPHKRNNYSSKVISMDREREWKNDFLTNILGSKCITITSVKHMEDHNCQESKIQLIVLVHRRRLKTMNALCTMKEINRKSKMPNILRKET